MPTPTKSHSLLAPAVPNPANDARSSRSSASSQSYGPPNSSLENGSSTPSAAPAPTASPKPSSSSPSAAVSGSGCSTSNSAPNLPGRYSSSSSVAGSSSTPDSSSSSSSDVSSLGSSTMSPENPPEHQTVTEAAPRPQAPPKPATRTPFSPTGTLIQIPPEARIASRHVTAIHALDLLSTSLRLRHRSELIAAHLDCYAHDLCLNRSEVRRTYLLYRLANLPPQSCLPMKQPYRNAFMDVIMDVRPPFSADARRHPDIVTFQKSRTYLSRSVSVRADPFAAGTVREARDTLSSAAWEGVQRRNRVFAMLQGEETISELREDGLFEDDIELESMDDEDDFAEEADVAMRDDEHLSAVRELPESDGMPLEILKIIARRVEDFAYLLRQAPPLRRVSDVLKFVQTSQRFEREPQRELNRIPRVAAAWNLEAPKRSIYGSCMRPAGPSGIPYRMALHRVDTMKWMSDRRHERAVKSEQKTMRDRLRKGIFKSVNITLHPVAWDLITKTFSSLDQFFEDLPTVAQFAELMGRQKHTFLLRAMHQHQTDILYAQMKIPDQAIARKLIANLSSARCSLRVHLSELEWILKDSEEAHHVSQCMHGYHRKLYGALLRRVRLPYFVCRVILDAFTDLPGAQRASFSAFADLRARGGAKPQSDFHDGLFTLTVDESLNAYQAVHQSGLDIHEDAWKRFDASWSLFRQVCTRTNVKDCSGITILLLDETKYGAHVLEALAANDVQQTCLLSPELTTDDAIRLKSFACSFVPSNSTPHPGGAA